MTVGKVCNREVVVTWPDSSVRETAKLMRDHHVGDVVVVEERDGSRVPVGIVTDRDLVLGVIAEDVSLDSVSTGDIMSFELVTVGENDSLWDAVQRMRVKAVRRMPVLDDKGALAGILALDDLLELLSGEFADLARVSNREQDRERHLRR